MHDKFFRDKTGKIVLWQAPNVALIGWAATVLANYFVHSTKLAWLGTAFLFAWAFMELYEGANYFRRLLGLVVLIFIVIMQFK